MAKEERLTRRVGRKVGHGRKRRSSHRNTNTGQLHSLVMGVLKRHDTLFKDESTTSRKRSKDWRIYKEGTSERD